MTSNRLFWIINTAGWLAFLLFSGLIFAFLSGQLNVTTFFIQIAALVYYVPASGLLRLIINRLGWFERKGHWALIGWLLVISLVLALCGQFLLSLFMLYWLEVMTWANYSWPTLLITTMQNWIVLCAWMLLYLVIKHTRNARQQRLRQIQLESSLRATELQALKAQLNPHFIFNCLNNMRALAIDDGETTRKMITHLSEILKYSFQFGAQNTVSVSREIQHVKNYLALESIQFEDRLAFNFTVNPATKSLKIPTFSIQLLVENAIKHGIMRLAEGGKISVETQIKMGRLLITVNNNGQLQIQTSTPGVGLINLKQRLQLLCGEGAAVSLAAIDENTVSAQITIPLENTHEP